jgi:hypothetical protein
MNASIPSLTLRVGVVKESLALASGRSAEFRACLPRPAEYRRACHPPASTPTEAGEGGRSSFPLEDDKSASRKDEWKR